MNLVSEKILVTGADGFIGSHLVESLVRKGCKVRALTQYNSFNSHGWLDSLPPDVQKTIEFSPGDIRDPFLVKESMKGCSVVFHLAALIAIPYSYVSPASYVDTNVHGTLNVVQAARDLSIDKVLHTSTSEVYGSAQFVPITEEHPISGQSPYSASKIGADQLALSFYKSFGTPVSVVRPFNTYGPRQSARAVIPTIIAQIASGKKEIRLGALEPTRDLLFVRDTVKGFMAIAEAECTDGEVINLGTGHEISIGNLAAMIAETMDASIAVVPDQERLRPEKSEVDRLLADASKAKNLTGWSAEFSGLVGLRAGLVETIDWFCAPANLARYSSDDYVV